MQYDFILADDDAMPAGKDWLFIRHSGGHLLVLRRSALGSAKLIHETWAAVRAGVFSPPEIQLRAV